MKKCASSAYWVIGHHWPPRCPKLSFIRKSLFCAGRSYSGPKGNARVAQKMWVHLCGRCFASGSSDGHWTATNDQALDASNMPDCILVGLDYMMRHAHNYEGCPQKSTTTEDLSDISEPRYDLNVSNLSFCKYGLTRHLCPHMHHDWQRICVSKVGGRGRGRYILGIRYSGAGILGVC